MKIGLFQKTETPGVFYAIARDGRSLAFRDVKGYKKLAAVFGYQGVNKLQETLEWLSEKATVVQPQQAELEIEDPGLFAPGNKL